VTPFCAWFLVQERTCSFFFCGAAVPVFHLGKGDVRIGTGADRFTHSVTVIGCRDIVSLISPGTVVDVPFSLKFEVFGSTYQSQSFWNVAAPNIPPLRYASSKYCLNDGLPYVHFTVRFFDAEPQSTSFHLRRACVGFSRPHRLFKLVHSQSLLGRTVVGPLRIELKFLSPLISGPFACWTQTTRHIHDSNDRVPGRQL
jgi:hypothetical protein